MIPEDDLLALAQTTLATLCQSPAGRPVGSPANQAAVHHFAAALAACAFEVTTPTFACLDWHDAGAELHIAGRTLPVSISRYSLGCEAVAPLVAISSVAELEQQPISGRIVLLHGAIAQEQFMPKHFPFYTDDGQQQILRLLEAQPPQAIIAAPPGRSLMAGAQYPFPLFEDGDFDVPSVYVDAATGKWLCALAGQTATLTIRAERRPATGSNVVARRGDPGRRVVVCAHIDGKAGTPGALDNAAGVTTLRLLAELLRATPLAIGVEIVAINGEDDYAAPGEKLFLAANAGQFEAILLGINLDGVGYQAGSTVYSLYDCPPALAATLTTALAAYPALSAGDPWYQGDHAMFLLHHRPALAFTSQPLEVLLAEIIHTERDTSAQVDVRQLVTTARALHHLLGQLS